MSVWIPPSTTTSSISRADGSPSDWLAETTPVPEYEPSTILAYDFLAFVERGQPISVRTIRREHHVNDNDTPEEERGNTIDTVEYSDGFGRLLQTRTQAEDVRFGDPAFGNQVLPVDQDDHPGAMAAVVGQQRGPDVDPRNWTTEAAL